MKLKTIVNIIGWVVLLAAFGALGFTSDNPAVGVPLFTVFFVIVFGLVYLYARKHQKLRATNIRTVSIIHKIIAVLLAVLALFSPIIALRKINLPFAYNIIILIFTAIMIGLGVLAVSLINNRKGETRISSLLGYLLLIIISAIPALAAGQFLSIYFPSAYNALGTAYWAVLSVAIFSWWSFSLYFKKERE
ncbi:MAG: hypothetical protein JXB60_05225 [Candidatus Cloacimonetes bacterium]|nr:hypothetical protein [Candidatus Cloacimonadota bacterium]